MWTWSQHPLSKLGNERQAGQRARAGPPPGLTPAHIRLCISSISGQQGISGDSHWPLRFRRWMVALQDAGPCFLLSPLVGDIPIQEWFSLSFLMMSSYDNHSTFLPPEPLLCELTAFLSPVLFQPRQPWALWSFAASSTPAPAGSSLVPAGHPCWRLCPTVLTPQPHQQGPELCHP